jgi:S1-C subfamily serine protease
MGYPRAIGLKRFAQIEYDKPLLRRGIVAGKNVQRHTIILDCQTNGGNSGGPVIEIDRVSLVYTQFRIIGIVTQFVPWLNATLSKQDTTVSNSGYTVAVPIDVIFELTQQTK